MAIATHTKTHVNCDACNKELSHPQAGYTSFTDEAHAARVATGAGWTVTPDCSTAICPRKDENHDNARTVLATGVCPTCGHHKQDQQ